MMRPVLISVALLAATACAPKNKGVETPADDGSTTTTTVVEGSDAWVDVGSGTETQEPAAAAPAKPVFERVNEAVALLTTGNAQDAARAEEALRKILDEDDTVAMAWFNVGVAEYQQDNLREAGRAFQTAVDLDPSLGDAYLYLGVLREREGQVGVAVSKYRAGIEKDPENMELRVALVGALRQLGRTDDAVEEAKKALAFNANNLAIYNNLGLIYMDQGEYKLANFIYMKALGTIPGAEKHALINCNLGRNFYFEERKGQALYYLLQAVELDPKLVPALVYLSDIYMGDHNYEDAVPLLESAKKESPDNVDVRINLGIAYRGIGKLDLARAEYDKALELDPARIGVQFNIGILEGDYRKDYDKGIAAFQSYIDAGGEQAELAQTYIDDLEKERKRADKKRKAEEDRKKREAERIERERLLKEEEDRRAKETAAPAPAPAAPAEGSTEGDEAGADDAGTEGDSAPEPAEEAPPAEEPAPSEEAPAEEPVPTEPQPADPWGDQQPAEEAPAEEAPAEEPTDNPWGQ